ncbi:hypothetical protein SESBI_11158 [Sesbania bispinosa]|nr:hypothetical protein SESBI_11158 [Sesbania bispinosa]
MPSRLEYQRNKRTANTRCRCRAKLHDRNSSNVNSQRCRSERDGGPDFGVLEENNGGGKGSEEASLLR